MRTVPSYKVTDHTKIPVGIINRLSQVLGKEISFEKYGTDSTNLVRASSYDLSVAYSPVGDVAYILSVTLRT
ncbi:hypothetical protein D3C81_1781850 [compost metagenome]